MQPNDRQINITTTSYGAVTEENAGHSSAKATVP
jgi:hypothetical protein